MLACPRLIHMYLVNLHNTLSNCSKFSQEIVPLSQDILNKSEKSLKIGSRKQVNLCIIHKLTC